MRCVCGEEFKGTSITPWTSVTLDSNNKVIRGICIHGVALDFGEFRLEDKVEVVKDKPGYLMTWKGVQGFVKHAAGSGELGVEIQTCCYGPVMIWIEPANLKKV